MPKIKKHKKMESKKLVEFWSAGVMVFIFPSFVIGHGSSVLVSSQWLMTTISFSCLLVSLRISDPTSPYKGLLWKML